MRVELRGTVNFENAEFSETKLTKQINMNEKGRRKEKEKKNGT
jgi:hypothetical protein